MLTGAHAQAAHIKPGNPTPDLEVNGDRAGTDTVYFGVVDGEGNACSFINSNYMGFGTGTVVTASHVHHRHPTGTVYPGGDMGR